MSLRYTTIRLWWNGRTGQAQYDGVHRELTSAPDVMQHVHELDYAPELRTFQIRERPCDPRRDLEPPEQELLLRWLAAFAASVKRGIRT